MPRRLTQEEFIERARRAHGDKYDYSKVNYVNSATKICIICPEHGEFWQTPMNHLSGSNCPVCARSCSVNGLKKIRPHKRKAICDLGINDFDTALEGESKRIYHIWRAILKRCYSEDGHKKQPTYRKCTVCKEWLLFSNFYNWFISNQIEGWCLDKDILVKGNKEYAPDKCCFVPNEINVLFNKHQNKRCRSGACGVFKKGNRFYAVSSMFGKNIYLGGYNNIEEAKAAYKKGKEIYIKSVAEKWKDTLSDKVYNALIKYEFSFDD